MPFFLRCWGTDSPSAGGAASAPPSPEGGAAAAAPSSPKRSARLRRESTSCRRSYTADQRGFFISVQAPGHKSSAMNAGQRRASRRLRRFLLVFSCEDRLVPFLVPLRVPL